jgi:hypothetical protein
MITFVSKSPTMGICNFAPNHDTMLFRTAILLLISAFTTAILAQPEVSTERLSMMRGVHDALVLEIPHPKTSFAESEWKDFVSKYGRPDKVRKTNEWLLQSAHLVNYPAIDYVNIYAEASELDSTVKFAAWFETDTTFFGAEEYPEQWAAATSMMQDFAIKVTRDLILEELDDEEKSLDKLKSDLDRLERNHEKYVETVDRAHADIRQAESDIVANTAEQEATTAEMESYSTLEGDPDAAKALKKLEKEMNKLKKRKLNYLNSIASNKERITQNEANIEQNLVEQEEKREEIKAQEAVVAEVRERLDEIRAKDTGDE